MKKMPSGIRIGGTRISITALFIIFSILLLGYAYRIGYFESPIFQAKESQASQQLQDWYKESLALGYAKAGVKQATVTGPSGRQCEIIEPVYAQLQCIVGESNTDITLSPTNSNFGPKIPSNAQLIKKVSGFKIPKEKWIANTGAADPVGACTPTPPLTTLPAEDDAEVWEVDWTTIKQTYTIKGIKCEDSSGVCKSPFSIMYKTTSGELGWVYGPSSLFYYKAWKLFPDKQSSFNEIPSNADKLYIFRLNVIESGTPCRPWYNAYANPDLYDKNKGGVIIQPSTPGDWSLTLSTETRFLEYSIPGSEGPYRVQGSWGCTAADVNEILSQTDDEAKGFKDLSFKAGVASQEAAVKIASMRKLGIGGILNSNVEKSALDYADSNLNNLIYNGPNLIERQAAIWIQYYRNTNIAIDLSDPARTILTDSYKGTPVICDQARKRLLAFEEVPLSPYQQEKGLCYVLPSREVTWQTIPGDINPIFSCSESFCSVFGASAGKPDYDMPNKRCVPKDQGVSDKPCIGTGANICDPQKPEYYSTNQGVMKTFGVCIKGTCAKQTVEVECMPDEQLLTKVCVNDKWIDTPIYHENCPPGSCCYKDLKYNDNPICPGDLKCCADFRAGDTKGRCQTECEDIVITIEEICKANPTLTQCSCTAHPELEKCKNGTGFFDFVAGLLQKFLKLLGIDMSLGTAKVLAIMAIVYVVIILFILGLVLLSNTPQARFAKEMLDYYKSRRGGGSPPF